MHTGAVHSPRRAAGIDTKYKTFTAGEARSRTTVIITNRNVDATLIS